MIIGRVFIIVVSVGEIGLKRVCLLGIKGFLGSVKCLGISRMLVSVDIVSRA